MPDANSRSSQLDRALADLLAQAPEVEAAAVVTFDGLPMASAAERAPRPSYDVPSYAALLHEPAVATVGADAVVGETVATYAPAGSESTWPSYLPNGPAAEPPAWS